MSSHGPSPSNSGEMVNGYASCTQIRVAYRERASPVFSYYRELTQQLDIHLAELSAALDQLLVRSFSERSLGGGLHPSDEVSPPLDEWVVVEAEHHDSGDIDVSACRGYPLELAVVGPATNVPEGRIISLCDDISHHNVNVRKWRPKRIGRMPSDSVTVGTPISLPGRSPFQSRSRARAATTELRGTEQVESWSSFTRASPMSFANVFQPRSQNQFRTMPSIENIRDKIVGVITRHPRALLVVVIVVLAGCGGPDGGGGGGY